MAVRQSEDKEVLKLLEVSVSQDSAISARSTQFTLIPATYLPVSVSVCEYLITLIV